MEERKDFIVDQSGAGDGSAAGFSGVRAEFGCEAASVRRWTAEEKQRSGHTPRYFIRTYGCQQNDHDSEIAAGILEQMGFAASETMEAADLILFNTCSIRANADDRFFGNVGSLKPLRKNGRPYIGVFGCMMEQKMHADTVKSTFPLVDFILGAGAMTAIPAALSSVLRLQDKREGKTLDFTGTAADSAAAGILPVRRRDAHRALISIMTGCNNFCTYCIVPYTRGREKSRPMTDIVQEAREAVRQGAREIMLLGQNVNSYGAAERKQTGASADYPTFASLLSELSHIEGLHVLRYMTSHPKDLSDELIEVIGRCPVVEPHIHLPLQSGSDRILRKMNRHYDSAHFLRLVQKLRAVRPGITISTDLIVGFPGETEEDFESTLRVMEEARFDAAFTFIYSPRAGTPAAAWAEQAQTGEDGVSMADDAVVHARFDRLSDLQNRLSFASNRLIEGQDVDVLIDGPSRRSPNIFSGRTRDNRLVNFSAHVTTTLPYDTPDGCQAASGHLPLPGAVVRVHIDRAKAFSLEGTLYGADV